MKIVSTFKSSVVLLILCLATWRSAHAANIVWNAASGTDTNWSTGANWVGGVAPAGDDVQFFDTGTNGVPGTPNNLVDGAFTGTIASLRFGNTNGSHTTVIASGATLTITNTGGLIAGTPGDVGAARALTNTITGAGGTLAMTHTNAVLALAQGTATGVNGSRSVLNLSGLDTFNANIFKIGIGTTTSPNPGNANQREAGILFLARTNTITLNLADSLANYLTQGNRTNGIEISRNPGNNGGTPSLLYLGQANTINVDSISVGRDKNNAGATYGWMGFNPAFASPSATFRGVSGGSSRVTFWAVGDGGAAASSSNGGYGTNDFSNGIIDALVDAMTLGRDCSASSTWVGPNRGVFVFAAGTVDVNTLYVGNQALGPSTSTTPNSGIMNVIGASAVLKVNNSIVLGNTVQTSAAANATAGTLNVRNGTVLANSIAVGTLSMTNTVTLTNATLVLSNTAASPLKGITTFATTNSTLQLNITGLTNIVVTNLVTGGATNLINPASVAVFASYPTQVALIKYFGTMTGAGFNFGFGAGSIPLSAPNAYLSNNVANKSIDLVLPTDPRPIITSTSPSYGGSPGDDVTFSVTYTGVSPLTFQWLKDGTNIADGPTGNGSTLYGTTTSALSVTNAQELDSGNYVIVLANSFGSTTSAPPHALIISTNPIAPIVSGPFNQTVIEGNDATFSAAVSGKPFPTLQWQRDGADVGGATGQVLTVTNVQFATDDGAVYSLIASNEAGVVTNSAVLTVIVPPTISVHPQNVTVTNTQPASFSVTASGVPSPTYQWTKNGSPIAGATNSTLSFGSAVPTNAAVYAVVVSNPAGTVASSNATLLVNSTMSFTSLFPANNATGVCVDTPLRITFNVAPAVGTAGRIRIYNATNTATPVDTLDISLNVAAGVQARLIAGAGYNTFPVTFAGNTANIYPHLGVLTTNQTYYVTIENVINGTFKDSAGATFAGINDSNVWTFSTKPTGPADTTDLVVAADGSGDFCTVQGAVDSVPAANTTPTRINIRNGFYQEIVYVNQKNNLTFIGQNRDQTQISYPNNDALNAGTALRPSFRLQGNDNSLVNLTLTNSTPKGGTQAEALRTDGRRIALLNVKLASFQDTMLNNNNGDIVYVQDSLIQGDTDFIWGSSTLFVTNCEIRILSSGSPITQARTTAGTNGFSFVNCTVTRSNAAVVNCNFGRSLGFADGNVAFIRCRIDAHITGWQDSLVRSWEFGNSNLLATAPTNYNGVQLPDGDPRLLLAQDATSWLYGWMPAVAPVIVTQPASQSVAGGGTANFSVAAIGIENPAYQWLKNGTNLLGQTASTLTISGANANDVGNYSVIVSNTAGTVASTTVTLTVGNTAPTLAPISDQTINVGVAVNVTNMVTDPDQPAQTFTFALLSGPTNAVLDSGTGVFTWRPIVSQAGTTNLISVSVTDDGTPNLSGTNSFTVIVNPLLAPTVSSPSYTGGQFSLLVSGQAGPDYAVEVSTDLGSGIWTTLFITNSPPSPFEFIDTNAAAADIQFYRIKVGPPLP
jgi:hypothetical protein